MNEELKNLGIGFAAVEAGPAAVSSIFENLTDATGTKLEFLPDELPDGAEHFLLVGAETAQAVAPAAALALLVYYGFKKMFNQDKTN